MRPEKLVMRNFGPFSGTVELDFSRLEDIFLITGKTGAGKTTIFDALGYALYGSVPGSRKNHVERLRSDHVNEGDECFVSLEFSMGDRRYLAERCPKQERKKKRGEGTVSMEETLAFFEISGGVKINRGSKKSEADAMIRELLGLEADEFFKIVLLPQGDFAQFLKGTTTERQKVLEKLFPVEKAMKVTDLARRKATEAESLAAAAAHTLTTIRQRFDPEKYEKIYQDAQSALEKLKAGSIELEKEEVALNQALSLKRNERDTENRLKESRGKLDEADKAEASINEKIEKLSRSRSARPLEQFFKALRTAELSAKTAAAAYGDAEKEKDSAQKMALEAEKNTQDCAAHEKEILALREKRPGLAESINEEAKLKAAEDELKKQEAMGERLFAGIARLLDDLEKQEADINETEALAADLPSLDKEYSLLQSVRNLFLEFRKYHERRDGIEKERSLINREVEDLERRGGSFKKRIAVLEEELSSLRLEKSRKEQADMAGHLSVILAPGKPCPVCGSTEHPCPAQQGECRFDYDDRIEAQEASLSEAKKLLAATETRLEVRKADGEKSGESLNLLVKEISETRKNLFSLAPDECPSVAQALPYLSNDSPLPGRELVDDVIKAGSERLNETIRRQKVSRDAAGKISELYRLKSDARIKLSDAEKSLAANEEQKKNLSSRIGEGREKQRDLINSIRGETASFSAELFSGSANKDVTASAVLTVLDRLINEKENLVRLIKDEREKALLRLSGANAALEGALRNRDSSAAALEESRLSLEKAISKTDFSSPREAGEALLEANAEDDLENGIQLWRENRAGLRNRIAEQERQLLAIRGELETVSPGKISVLEEAETRLITLKRERAEADLEKNRAFSDLANLQLDREAHGEAVRRYNELAERARKYKTLSDDLTGKNPKKLSFDSWLLGNYLEEAAAYATTRLEKMSESRYSLLLDSERQQGRANAGLDLLVFDAHTGKTRPCATLSGGESFMASISLALGLADSIQNRSGGVRLDAVFIDEGFGTLDEASLDKALVILDELRDRRMVGLISHVGELRSRIPCRVEVVKTESGSTIIS